MTCVSPLSLYKAKRRELSQLSAFCFAVYEVIKGNPFTGCLLPVNDLGGSFHMAFQPVCKMFQRQEDAKFIVAGSAVLERILSIVDHGTGHILHCGVLPQWKPMKVSVNL